MSHSCDALVVSCIDFRFQKFIRSWLESEFKDKLFDYVAYAGASKDLPVMMGQLDISVRLHSIKEVYLINHEDCGAYGSVSTRERHGQDLKKAKDEINAKYPQLSVKLFYLHLDGTFEEIN